MPEVFSFQDLVAVAAVVGERQLEVVTEEVGVDGFKKDGRHQK